MSRQLRFIDKDLIPPQIPSFETDPLDALELVEAIIDSFKSQGCKVAGSHLVEMGQREVVKDPDWGADIGELVARATPHPTSVDSGPPMVKLELRTVVAEIDDLDEICCWIYETSAE